MKILGVFSGLLADKNRKMKKIIKEVETKTKKCSMEKKGKSHMPRPKTFKSLPSAKKTGLKNKINEVLSFWSNLGSLEWEVWSKKIKKIKWLDFTADEFGLAKDSVIELIEILQNGVLKLGHQLERVQFQLHSEEKFWRESDETKADFLSLVSHQLRTPLTVSLLNTEILLFDRRSNLSLEQRKSLQEIFVSLKKMTEMLNVFSIVSKIELSTFVMKARTLNLTEMLDKILADCFEDCKGEKVDISVNHDERAAVIKADADLIKIALSNLVAFSIRNALDKKDGKVKIITCGDSLGVFICFFNSGPSIPVADQDKIFSKGYRTHGPNRENLSDIGLGFYISKTIIDRSGGRIWFESSPEVGTSFHVFLPKENNTIETETNPAPRG